MEQGTEERLKLEDRQLFDDILKRNYYKEFKKINPQKNLELIINRKNKVSSCYGCFNNDETRMYFDVDFSENDYSKININLTAMMKYYQDNQWNCNIELTGIDWTNNYDEAISVLEILFNYFKEQYAYRPKIITINTDGCFIASNVDLISIYKNYIEKFNSLNIILYFNIYRNGLLTDYDKWNEEQYNNLFSFLHSINYKIITYITADNVKQWIENYQWWLSKLGAEALTKIELREQKNDKWSKDAISDYLLFLNYQVDSLQKIYNSESNKIFFDRDKSVTFQTVTILDNKYTDNVNNNNNCNMFKNLTIDLTSMNVVPCAKTNYKDFASGSYIVENGSIISTEGKNIPMLIYSTHLKQMCLPHCESCNHLNQCSGHCFGESYNKCFDLLVPIREFCELSKAKTNFLIYKFSLLNLIDKEMLKSIGCDTEYIGGLIVFKNGIMGDNK